MVSVGIACRVEDAAHGASFERDAVSVVEQPVEDGVAEGGIAYDLMPVVDGDLAGHEGSLSSVSVVEDLQVVTASEVVEAGKTPVID